MKRTIFAVTGVISAIFLGGAMQSSAAISPAPLTVKVSTYDGGNKVQVAKKVKAFVSCSKDCNITVKVKLISPINTIKASSKDSLKPQNTYRAGFLLTSAGLSYLKTAYRNCKFYISVRAVDLETGKVVKKTRTYRFER